MDTDYVDLMILHLNVIVIPGSKTESHIKENTNIFDLTKEDMMKIASINKDQPFYGRKEEVLKQFATWRPDVEGQK